VLTVLAVVTVLAVGTGAAAMRAGGATFEVVAVLGAATDAAGASLVATAAVSAGALTAVTAVAAVTAVTAGALGLERPPTNAATTPTIATTASATAPTTIGPWLRRAGSSLSAGTKVTGGANSGVNAPPLLRFMMSSAGTLGAGGGGTGLASVASEKSTLLSLRSPVSGVAAAYTSSRWQGAWIGKDSPHRLQRTFTLRPFRRSVARV
jgi:hypothetical protein